MKVKIEKGKTNPNSCFFLGTRFMYFFYIYNIDFMYYLLKNLVSLKCGVLDSCPLQPCSWPPLANDVCFKKMSFNLVIFL